MALCMSVGLDAARITVQQPAYSLWLFYQLAQISQYKMSLYSLEMSL